MKLLLAARKSTQVRDDDGQQIDAISIDTQDKKGRAWAERNGHTIIDVAADVKSGTVAPWDRKNLRPWVTRPELMAQYDGILAYDNSRLSRGCWSDEARIRQWAEEHGKVLMIVEGAQWPPRNDGDEWQWEAMAKQARKTWEANREASMRAQDELRENGKLVGRPPFGYAATGSKYGKTIVPTDEGRTYIPQIFERVIKGASLAVVAYWLETQGVRPVGVKGKKTTGWWPRSIGQIIRNPVYIGHRTDAAGRTILRCEPLVDAATFKAAGLALDGRPKKGPQRAENKAMLAGAIFCGNPDCSAGPDSPMYRIGCQTRKKGQKTTLMYYRCAGRGAARKGCGNMVRLEVADAAMNALAAEWFTRPVLETRVTPGHDHAAELEDLKFELRQLAARDLPWEAEDAERARLRAEYDRVAALPVVPAVTETIQTGEVYADVWQDLAASERGSWLKEQGLTVQATSRAMWFREDGPAVRSFLARANGDVVTDRRQLIYIYPPKGATA